MQPKHRCHPDRSRPNSPIRDGIGRMIQSVPQLPLDLSQAPARQLEDYLGAAPDVLALLEAAAMHAGADWVFVHGVAGVGKSHLLLGCVSRARQCGREATYLPLDMAHGRLREALHALEQHALVAVDDVQAIAGNADDEQALFEFHNRMHDLGHTMVYAGQWQPDACGLQLPDLVSRLGQCTRIRLQPLDDAGRGRLLRQHAMRRGLELDAASVDWLLQHLPRDAASLLAAVNRLDQASLAARRRLTLPFLRQVLAESGPA